MDPELTWKPIPGHESYWVSEDGQFWSTKRNRLLKTSDNRGTYYKVSIDDRTLSAHRLVAFAFLGAPQFEGAVVRHLDDNGKNNRYTNLAWGTYLENNRDIVNHGRHANQKKTHCPQGHEYNAENTYYLNGGRLCKICRDERQKMRRLSPLDENDPKHGTRTGYVYGCRCDACLTVEKEYQASRRRS